MIGSCFSVCFFLCLWGFVLVLAVFWFNFGWLVWFLSSCGFVCLFPLDEDLKIHIDRERQINHGEFPAVALPLLPFIPL